MLDANVIYCTGAKQITYQVDLHRICYLEWNLYIVCHCNILHAENERKKATDIAGSKIKVGSFYFPLNMFPGLSQSP